MKDVTSASENRNQFAVPFSSMAQNGTHAVTKTQSIQISSLFEWNEIKAPRLWCAQAQDTVVNDIWSAVDCECASQTNPHRHGFRVAVTIFSRFLNYLFVFRCQMLFVACTIISKLVRNKFISRWPNVCAERRRSLMSPTPLRHSELGVGWKMSFGCVKWTGCPTEKHRN